MSALIGWILVAFGQPAWAPWFGPMAASFGYALLWRKTTAFWPCAAWFFAVQLVQLSWMSATEYQGLYILGVYVGLGVALGLQFGWVSSLTKRWPHLAVSGLWTLLEWSRLYVLSGFSWNPVGLSLTGFIPSLQMAALLGIFGLSFWVMLTNLACLHRKWRAWGALTVVPYLLGLGMMGYYGPRVQEAETLSVGLVQTGLLPHEKIPLAGRESQFISPYAQWSQIVDLVKTQRGEIELLVLPEYAVPFPAEEAHYRGKVAAEILGMEVKEEFISNRDWMQLLGDKLGAEVVSGLDADEGPLHYSAAFHSKPKERDYFRRYEKQVLVPLAEYLPFPWLKTLTAAYGITEFFTRGQESKVFEGQVPFSVSICYEETFPEVMRAGRKLGAELFVNVTNDGWYPHSKLAKQHFFHGRVRAVENGVSLVRACNTGVTAAVDSLGRIVDQIEEEMAPGVLVVDVPREHHFTLFTLWGNALIVGLSLLFLGVGWMQVRRLPEREWLS